MLAVVESVVVFMYCIFLSLMCFSVFYISNVNRYMLIKLHSYIIAVNSERL